APRASAERPQPRAAPRFGREPRFRTTAQRRRALTSSERRADALDATHRVRESTRGCDRFRHAIRERLWSVSTPYTRLARLRSVLASRAFHSSELRASEHRPEGSTPLDRPQRLAYGVSA